MKFLIVPVMACAALLTASSAKADLIVSGQSTVFAGPGSYTLDIFATAVGASEEVGGYNITLDFSDPDLTFSNVIYNTAFESTLPAAGGSDPVLLQATDTNFVGLSIPAASTSSLASITFNAVNSGSIGISVVQMNDTFFGPIATTVSSALSVQPVPEPSAALASFALAGVGVAFRRRRRVVTAR